MGSDRIQHGSGPTEERAPGALAAFRGDLSEGFHRLWRRTSAGHKRMVLFVIAGGAILRIILLREPVIYDEAFTYTHYATRPASGIMSDYSYPNNHILHTLLVRLTTSLFGVGEVALRLPALLAGIAAMPLFYLFVRAMFNRYIALMTLALIASSAGLIEYSALARGYSITWLCMVGALLLGRHLAKSNNTVTAILLALVNALGMWAVPTMIYPTVAIHIWLVFYLMTKYRSSLNQRLRKLLLSSIVFVLLVLLFYAPVVIAHGVGQLFLHPGMGDSSWETFMATHQDRSFDLWAYFTTTTSTWMALTGVTGLLGAIYISSKYRMLLLGIILGAVPIVLLQHMVAPPGAWTYSLFIFHLGVAIALFYLLKLIQDRLFAGFAKRMRTILASAVIVVVFGILAVRKLPARVERFSDARLAAAYLRPMLGAQDRVMAEFPWEAPIEFYLMARNMDRQVMVRDPSPGSRLYLVVSPADGQSPGSVLMHNKLGGDRAAEARKLMDWKRLEIYSTHLLAR